MAASSAMAATSSWHSESTRNDMMPRAISAAGLKTRPTLRIIAALVVVVAGIHDSPAAAQLTLAKNNPVVYGHHHIAASDLAAHMKFFVDALGGTKTTFGPNT